MLRLKLTDRLSLEQIGARLGITANAAGQRVHRALERLLAAIEVAAPGELPGRGR